MKKPFPVLALSGLAAGFILAACDSASEAVPASPSSLPSGEVPGSPSAYESEVLSLKAEIADPEAQEEAIRSAMIRHGFRPAGSRPHSAPQAPSAPVGAAAKSAAWEEIIRAKDFEFDFPSVITKRIDVSDQWTLSAYTSRESGAENVDPRIVAFYPEETDALRTKTRIVGLNDDYSGLDSRFTWKNTTGSTRKVTIHVFAYSHTSTGTATLTYKLTSPTGRQGAVISDHGHLGAVAVSDNLPPTRDCEDPDDSVIRLNRVFGGGFDAGLIAVNGSLMRGGYVHEGRPSLALGFVLPPGRNNFLLGIFEFDGTIYEDSRYRAMQDDFYDWCL